MRTIAAKSNFSFPEGGCRCQMIDTDTKKKNNVRYAAIWTPSGEAQQTDKTDRHAGENQIRFSCLTWWIILSGRFLKSVFFLFFVFFLLHQDEANSVQIGKCWGKWLKCYAPLTMKRSCSGPICRLQFFCNPCIQKLPRRQQQANVGSFILWLKFGSWPCMCQPQRFYHPARFW